MAAATISALNLNLLVALDALLATLSVRRAAERTGVTQSALSHSLAKLRAMFDDPLLVRDGNRMLPTPLAEQIAGPLHQALLSLGRIVSQEASFEPARSARSFTLAASDALAVTALPRLLQRVRAAAPHVTLTLLSLDARVRRPAPDEPGLPEPGSLATRLASGEVDLALGPMRPHAELERQPLFDSEFVVVSRRRHPGIGKRLDLDTFCALPHAIVSAGGVGTSIIDQALAKLGRDRHIVVRVPYFLAAPALVAQSDLLLTVPRFVGEHFGAHYRLALHEPPLALPAGRIGMLWHRRFSADAAHRWLRAQVAEAAAIAHHTT